MSVHILTIAVKQNHQLYIETYFTESRCTRPRIALNDRTYDLVKTERVCSRSDSDEAFVYEIVIEPDMKQLGTVRFICGCDMCNEKTAVISCEMFSRIPNISGAYAKKGPYFIQKGRRKLYLYKKTKLRRILLEALFWLRLLVNWRLDAVLAAFKGDKRGLSSPIRAGYVIFESIIMIPRAYALRAIYFLCKRGKKTPIWIISDRGMSAGDNGEALFRYIKSLEDDGQRKIYFALSKSSPDYSRMRRIGEVINYGSLRYQLQILLADFVVSSQADIEVINPFLRQINHFVDLYDFNFVFLQHGIIRNDLSRWLNRYERNVALFVTSAERERQSVLRYPYYYKPESVLLSGLPRYDLLENKPEKKIIISPTYRAYLLKKGTNSKGERAYDKEFKNSNYFRFYNRLINDPRLLDAMQKNGYTGEFLLHPVFSAQLSDFSFNAAFKMCSYPYNYREIFKTGSLLISDYSSVVFDFAFLKKSIIYTKFDERDFFDGHTYDKGDFFEDSKDGFGPVTYEYDQLISEILHSIAKGCVMDKLYAARVEDFFYKVDHHNSKRVYESIVQLEG